MNDETLDHAEALVKIEHLQCKIDELEEEIEKSINHNKTLGNRIADGLYEIMDLKKLLKRYL